MKSPQAPKKFLLPVCLALAVAVPWVASDYFVMMCIRIMYFGMLTLSLCFLAGELGVVSLMQASFFGISGYFIAILQTRYHVPFPIPPLVGIAVAVLFAALAGFLVIRVRGIYFLMLTLVLGQLIWALASQWASVTRGDSGITDIYAPVIFGISTEKSKDAFYFFELIFFCGLAYFLAALKRSPFGLMLRGIRDSESRMAMLGYPVSLLRYLAFIFAAFVAAMGGVFFAYFTGLINPHSVSLTTNVESLLSGILGGIQTLFGAILGTAILKVLDLVLSGITQRYLLIMGILFLIVIMFAPKGAAGALKRLWEALTSRTLQGGASDGAAADDASLDDKNNR
jgi:branched-chain amino acid transport system permease protein